MSLNINIAALLKAVSELDLTYNIINKEAGFISLLKNNKTYFFIRETTPFNTQDFVRIVKDKDLTYKLLENYVKIPKTISYLDQNVKKKYKNYIKFNSVSEIKRDILKYFNYPLIIKRNSGRQGNNVFLCNNEHLIEDAIKTIFNTKSKNYDYILLAQEYVEILNEYRVIVFKGEIKLIYIKKSHNINGAKELNKFSNRTIINDLELIDKINKKFIEPIQLKLNLEFCAVDIVEKKDNTLYLMEINSAPGFNGLIKSNGLDVLIELYKEIFRML